MKETEKADGWVIRNPEGDWLVGKTFSADNDWCEVIYPTFESALKELKSDNDLQLEYSSENPDQGFSGLVPWLKEQGWRIRPVKLVFLDKISPPKEERE